MAAREPPKFTPFTKMKVVLALEATPVPIDQHTDLTAFAGQPFRAAGVTESAAEDDQAPRMFKKRVKDQPLAGEPLAAKPRERRVAEISEIPGLPMKSKRRVPAGPRIFARFNVESRKAQAEQLAALPADLKLYLIHI